MLVHLAQGMQYLVRYEVPVHAVLAQVDHLLPALLPHVAPAAGRLVIRVSVRRKSLYIYSNAKIYNEDISHLR